MTIHHIIPNELKSMINFTILSEKSQEFLLTVWKISDIVVLILIFMFKN